MPPRDPLIVALRAHREALGWSRAVLARRAGIHHETLGDLEEGRTRAGRLETLRAIAQAMDLDLGLHATTVAREKPGGPDTPENIARRRKILAEALAGASGRRRVA